MAGIRDLLKKSKKELTKRHKESTDRKAGVRFASIFDKTKIPEGLGFWSCGQGKHAIDIIPFLCGSQNPNVSVQEGGLEYVIDLWIHARVGVLESSYVCPSYTWRKPCPICNFMKTLGESPEDKELYKNIKPTRRVIYLVWVHDTPEEEKKGIQLWDVSHYLFHEPLDDLSNATPSGEPVVYSHPDFGKTIFFTREGSGIGTKYKGMNFIDREPLPDSILEQAEQVKVDMLITMHPSYQTIEAEFFGDQTPAEEDETPTVTEVEEGVGTITAGTLEHTHDSQGIDVRTPPRLPSRSTGTTNLCPVEGAIFGQHYDQLDECQDCSIRDDCCDEASLHSGKTEDDVPLDNKPEQETEKPKLNLRRPQTQDKPASSTSPLRRRSLLRKS